MCKNTRSALGVTSGSVVGELKDCDAGVLESWRTNKAFKGWLSEIHKPPSSGAHFPGLLHPDPLMGAKLVPLPLSDRQVHGPQVPLYGPFLLYTPLVRFDFETLTHVSATPNGVLPTTIPKNFDGHRVHPPSPSLSVTPFPKTSRMNSQELKGRHVPIWTP